MKWRKIEVDMYRKLERDSITVSKFKKSLKERGIKQRFIAQKTHIPEAYLSMAAQGKFNLNHEQKVKIAAVLNCAVSEIFEG